MHLCVSKLSILYTYPTSVRRECRDGSDKNGCDTAQSHIVHAESSIMIQCEDETEMGTP